MAFGIWVFAILATVIPTEVMVDKTRPDKRSQANTLNLFGWVRQSGPLSLVQISRDTGIWLVEHYYASAKVYAITFSAFRCVVMAW